MLLFPGPGPSQDRAHPGAGLHSLQRKTHT
jgi:hypothetical protein